MATHHPITWGNDVVEVTISHGSDRPPALDQLRPVGTDPTPRPAFGQPQSLVQLTLDGALQANFGSRYSETLVGDDLRYVRHTATHADGEHRLTVLTRSAAYGVEATVTLTAPDGVAAVRSQVTVTNIGSATRTLTSVSSLSTYVALTSGSPDGWDLVSGRSDWLAEGRWRREPLRAYELVRLLGVDSASFTDGDLSPAVTPVGGTVTRSSVSSRSTAAVLPVGAVVDADGRALVWQVESNGPWLWQLGERVDGVYLTLLGPTDVEHHWSRPLAPGESFSTVPVAVAVSAAGADGAIAELTGYRRHVLRPHPDRTELPVIFNDYMNTLMGDPTTAALLPLVDAAAEAGAEYFCIDCGWYDDGGDWWPSVGAWTPSSTRFPGGLTEVLDHIRSRGLRPGIWLEPEVVGVDSPVAGTLPGSAFLQRDGHRLRTHQRYHLDLRDPAARAHLDRVVDHLVGDLGIRFFKLDYNINADAGTDHDAPSRGDGLLEAGRAYLAWLDGVLDRHPDLTVETCSSGSMRSDGATLAHSQLQSTSDQQDFRQYANIAASAPMMMLPEQCGNWAYPNEKMTLAETRFTMLNGIVGRLYLSGYLTRMHPDQLAVVHEGVAVHRALRHRIARSVPFWPLGLPAWQDDLVVLGLRDDEGVHLAVWAKHGLPAGGRTLRLAGSGPSTGAGTSTGAAAGTAASAGSDAVQQVFGSPGSVTWEAATDELHLAPATPDEPFAVLLRLPA
ncbi:MAG TPA: glycoside hydrolase family 36 protein [Cellulomonas sp.]